MLFKMIEKLTIRPYTPSDKPQLVNIVKLHVPVYFAASEVEDLEEYLEHRREKYFVAEIDGKIVGAGGINLADNGKTGKISWDYVAPSFQGKGIGKALLRYRVELLQEMGTIEKITVRTSQFAYRFYEKNGFKLTSREKDYWSPGFDLYDMRYDAAL